jgi:sugar transferase EpsL
MERAVAWVGLRRFTKRAIDIFLGSVALIALSPVLLVLAALVAARLGRPVLFTQLRLGLHGRPFRIYKFRTMTDARGADGRLLADAERLTPLGRFLRRASLDELPGLLNVLRGEMSLVGPRPLITDYRERYTAEQARRMAMPPGITGLAQVSGRNALTWEDRFRLDVAYVDGWSLGLDLSILARTLLAVLGQRGISAEGHATMTEFLGSEFVSTRFADGPGHGTQSVGVEPRRRHGMREEEARDGTPQR